MIVDEHSVFWRLHADKLMWTRDNGTHTAMLGFQTVASWFNNTPPNSLDLEYTMQLVEDALAVLKPESFAVTDWFTDDKLFEQLSHLISGSRQVSRDQVEVFFQTLTQQLNHPGIGQLSLTNGQIAYLLALREAMFHLDMLNLRYLG